MTDVVEIIVDWLLSGSASTLARIDTTSVASPIFARRCRYQWPTQEPRFEGLLGRCEGEGISRQAGMCGCLSIAETFSYGRINRFCRRMVYAESALS